MKRHGRLGPIVRAGISHPDAGKPNSASAERPHSTTPRIAKAPSRQAWPSSPRADSVPNLTRPMDARLRARPQLADEPQQIMARIEQGAKNQVRYGDLLVPISPISPKR